MYTKKERERERGRNIKLSKQVAIKNGWYSIDIIACIAGGQVVSGVEEQKLLSSLRPLQGKGRRGKREREKERENR